MDVEDPSKKMLEKGAQVQVQRGVYDVYELLSKGVEDKKVVRRFIINKCEYFYWGNFVQTFLPYPDFQKSAEVLDFRRLGKQRSEALTIYRAIKDGNGWSNHPATEMWRGYTKALKLYHDTIIKEWIDRGYENNMDFFKVKDPIDYPAWLGDERLHDSHKSNLLRKDSDYYNQYNWKVPKNLDYFWPTKEDYPIGDENE